MNVATMPNDNATHGGTLKLHRGATFGEASDLPRQRLESRMNALIHGNWHDTCHNTYITHAQGNGRATLSVSIKRRGGARNRSDRVSHALTAAQIGNLRAAERHARRIGMPFNRMITISWRDAGVPIADMAKATGRFTDLLAKMLARHASGTAWLWTHENGHRYGWHVHLLVYVPASLVSRLTGRQRGWIGRITGKAYQAGVIQSKPVGGRLGLEHGNPALHNVNLEVAFGYVCKAAPQAVLDSFNIIRKHQPGGLVIGKRCGTSQNIGAKARNAERAEHGQG